MSSSWTVITVTYNSRDQLLACWTQADIGAARWLVVDNNSTDDSVTVARSLGATVIERATNEGFSVANNVGLAEVDTTWVAFVNPDVTISSPNDLDRLARVATANEGLVAPQLLNPDGTEQLNARGFPYPSHKLANRGLRLPGVELDDYARAGFDVPTYCAWTMGAAIGGATTLFRELGGWDESYFIYYEDHDIGLRCWLAGHTVVLDPAVRWPHQWQRETTHMRLSPWRHEFSSMRVFYRKYPELLTRGRLARSARLAPPRDSLWTKARVAT